MTEQYLTISDISKIANCSRATLYRLLKEDSLNLNQYAHQGTKGGTVYDPQIINAVRDRMRKKDLTAIIQSVNDAAASKPEAEPAQEQTAHDAEPARDASAALMMAIDALTKQLDAKDKQIADQSNQIETLTKMLSDSQEALRTAQALHAGSIKAITDNHEASDSIVYAEDAHSDSDPAQEDTKQTDTKHDAAAPDEKKQEGIMNRIRRFFTR